MITNLISAISKIKLLSVVVFLFLFILDGFNQANAGWYQTTQDNQSNVAWGDYHFEIFAIPGHTGDPMYDITNVVFDITPPPSSNIQLDSGNEWNLSSDGKKLNFNFYNNPYAAGAVGGWWKAHINNPDGVLHGVSTYPSVAPEPLSSILFVIGGISLVAGYRIKKRKTC